jgi:Periplasmic component of the Tol biopolymer transport system
MYFTTPAQAVCVGPGGSLTLVSIKGEEKNLEVAGNNPVWTADNQHILYDYQGKVWMVGTNGKNAAALTADGESYGASTPVNNPQGDLVAFVGTDAAGIANVYSLEMKTEAVRQLTAFFEPGTVEYVQWSPDGLYLAFLRGGQVWIMKSGRDEYA